MWTDLTRILEILLSDFSDRLKLLQSNISIFILETLKLKNIFNFCFHNYSIANLMQSVQIYQIQYKMSSQKNHTTFEIIDSSSKFFLTKKKFN